MTNLRSVTADMLQLPGQPKSAEELIDMADIKNWEWITAPSTLQTKYGEFPGRNVILHYDKKTNQYTPIGQCGERWNVITGNEIAKTAFDFAQENGLVIKQCGFIGGNQRFAFRMQIPDSEIKTGERRVGDTVDLSILLTASAEYGKSHEVIELLERLACLNGMTNFEAGDISRFNHSAANTANIQDMSKALNGICKRYQRFMDNYENLLGIALEERQAKQLIERMFGKYNDDNNEIKLPNFASTAYELWENEKVIGQEIGTKNSAGHLFNAVVEAHQYHNTRGKKSPLVRLLGPSGNTIKKFYRSMVSTLIV